MDASSFSKLMSWGKVFMHMQYWKRDVMAIHFQYPQPTKDRLAVFLIIIIIMTLSRLIPDSCPQSIKPYVRWPWKRRWMICYKPLPVCNPSAFLSRKWRWPVLCKSHQFLGLPGQHFVNDKSLKASSLNWLWLRVQMTFFVLI